MHSFGFLHDILILLLASVGVIIIFKQLRLSPVLGYLVAGAAIGPFGLGFLTSVATTKSIAEFGVVFLLFAIGLELTFERLMSMKKYVLGFGSLQIITSAAVISYISYKFFGLSLDASIVIGSALSLSSTAIVMQVIAEHAEQSTRVGRLSFSVLIMQDLAVIPILVLVPMLAKENASLLPALGEALLNGVIALVVIYIAGRLLLRPIYRLIAEAKNDALFLSFTLIVILGSSFISNKMGLSFAFGAFVAGLMVAETEYKYQVEEETMSLKNLLLGLFFMTIGMSFDFDFLLESFPLIIAISLGLILIKSSIVVLLCQAFRLPLAPSIHTGLLLSQGGEFAFIVFLLAVKQDFISDEVSQLLMTSVTFTMALTPLLATIGRKLKSQLYVTEMLRDNRVKREIGDITDHIIIIGFSRIGRIIAYILRKSGKPYIILDNNHRIVRIEKANGYNIYYGDATNSEILHHISTDKARMVLVTIDDEIATMKIIHFIREKFHDVSLITKSEAIKNIEKFRKIGANFVVSKNLETALQLSRLAMSSSGATHGEIEAAIESFRDLKFENIKDIIATDDTKMNDNEKTNSKTSGNTNRKVNEF